MSTKTLNRLIPLIASILLLCVYSESRATHAMGADLWYQCIDPGTNTYIISLRFYRDCSGVSVPVTETVNLSSATCGNSIDLILNQLPCPANPNGGGPCEVSPLCPAYIGQSQCVNDSNPYPGVEAFTYTTTFQMPAFCSDWIFSWSECCRNAAITNLDQPDTYELYVEARLNNLAVNYNSSPLFTTLPVPFICSNQPYAYNHGAVDAEGDSLVYSLVNPLSNLSAIPYTGSFTPVQPIYTSPPGSLTFGSSTGQMSFTPGGVQVATIAVLVEEYRNGVRIGSTMRDIQIVVLNLPGCGAPPIFNGITDTSVVNGFYVNNQNVQVCPGNALSFSVVTHNPTGDSLFVSSDAATSIPGAQVVIEYPAVDSVIAHINWTPTALDTGINNLVFSISNHNCPISSVQSFSVTIQVLSGTYAGPDAAYCPAGGPVQLQVFGGTQYNWLPATGLNNANISNPMASPVQTTTYVVTSNLSSACKNTDTITVYRVPDFTYSITQSKDTICQNELVDLQVTADPAFTYSYSWWPVTGLSSASTHNPVAQPLTSTRYTVLITSDTGCRITDSSVYIVVNQRPVVTVSADKYQVCAGDTIHLSAGISTLQCGPNTEPCAGTYDIKTIGTGVLQAPTPYPGLWEDGRMQLLFRAGELTAMGMQAGTITDIAFEIKTNNSSLPYQNFNIKMGCTPQNDLTGYIPGLTLVFTEPSFAVTDPGYSNHTLQTPYTWDGLSNLVVEICYDNPAGSFTQNDYVNGTGSGFNSVLYNFDDGTSGCAINQLPNISTIRPNVQLVYCLAPVKTVSYQWTPTDNLFPPDSLNAVVMPASRTTYELSASDGTCTGSAAVTLNIDTSFTISAGPDVPFCADIATQLAATVTGTQPLSGTFTCGLNSSICNGVSFFKTLRTTPATSPVTVFQGTVAGAQREDQRTQILYRAEDMLAAGYNKGTITQIGFRVTHKTSLFPFQSFNVKMGCTTKMELTDSTWEPAYPVYNSILQVTDTGWNEFPLASNFDWDGVTNIVVEVCWDNPDNFPYGGSDEIAMGNATYSAFHTAVAKSSIGCNLTPLNSEMYQLLPTMKVKICSPPLLPVNFEWQPSAALSNPHISNPTATPDSATLYTVTATFGGTCPRVDSIWVTPQSFNYTVSSDTGICSGSSILLTASGGTAYSWQPQQNNSCITCTRTVVKPDTTTLYYVHVSDASTGCAVDDSVLVTVQHLDVIAWFSDTVVEQGTQITIGVDASGGNGTYTYQWLPSDFLNNNSIQAPVSTPLTSTYYIAQVSSGYCTDTTGVNVRVNILETDVAMPNAFTPNGDGKNDLLFPVIPNAIIKVKQFSIYNRYGELVHNNNTAWDGKFKNSEQPPGTYVYYLLIERPYNEDEKLQGAVTLLR